MKIRPILAKWTRHSKRYKSQVGLTKKWDENFLPLFNSILEIILSWIFLFCCKMFFTPVSEASYCHVGCTCISVFVETDYGEKCEQKIRKILFSQNVCRKNLFMYQIGLFEDDVSLTNGCAKHHNCSLLICNKAVDCSRVNNLVSPIRSVLNDEKRNPIFKLLLFYY